MQTTTYRISEALRRIKERSLTIPQFQRPFTWRESQVKLLADSLARDYPIGSILLLAKSRVLQLQARPIDAVIREGFPPDDVLSPIESSVEHFYVLDGQQRLTAMARILLNAHPKKTYYFDLRALLQDFARDEATWVVARARAKSDPERRDGGRLLRSDLVLDAKKVEVYVSEYIEDSGELPEVVGNRQRQREAAAQIKSVFETIRNYQIPIVILERDAQVESVCRVFETINSTGTRLTTFDLAVARFFPKPDLRKLWEDTLEKYPLLRASEVEGERILQTMSLLKAAKDERSAEPTRGDLLSLQPEFIERYWDTAADSLHRTYQWARSQGARQATIPNHGTLVALAAFNALRDAPDASFKPTSEPVLRRWYFCRVLQQGARQAANYKIGQDFSALLRYLRTGQLPEFTRVLLDPASLIALNNSIDNRYRALQTLVAMTMRHDLVTGEDLNSDSELEDHHLYPRRLSKSHKIAEGKLNSIVNRLPLLAESNGNLSDREPKDYLWELYSSAAQTGTMGDFKRRLQDAMIPGDPNDPSWIDRFDVSRYEQFLADRSRLLLDRIHDVVGDSLVVSAPTADEAAEEDDSL